MKKFKKTKIISLTLMVALVSSTLAVPTNAETAAQVAKKAIKCFANGYDFGYKQFRALDNYDRSFRLANLLRFARENKKSALTAEEWDGMAKGDIAAKYNMGAKEIITFSHSLAKSAS